MTTAQFSKKLAPKGYVYQMEHAGYKARLMKAERLVGDKTFGLPPGEPVPVYPIAALPAAPAAWSREPGTYVCPVSSDWAIWFDWTMNDIHNTAIIPSVKGMNPITGEKIDSLDLHQYKDKCPIHGDALSHDRYCEKCGYKLPPQNYVSSPNTLWWDGFRQADGTVAQFFFTEDEKRDIASIVIGKENTVPAFGFAFFKPKNPKVVIPPPVTRGFAYGGPPIGASASNGSFATRYGNAKNKSFIDGNVETANVDWNKPTFFSPCHTPQNWDLISAKKNVSQSDIEEEVSNILRSTANNPNLKLITHHAVDKINNGESLNDEESSILAKAMVEPIRRSMDKVDIKTVSVGAGAKINQDLLPDTLEVDEWRPEPSGIIRLYFVFQNEFEKMLEEGGIKDISGTDAGYMEGLPQG